MESELMLTPREKILSARKILLRGGANPWHCIKQDSEPNKLPTSYSSPSSSALKADALPLGQWSSGKQ